MFWPAARAKLAGDPEGLALLDAMADEHQLTDLLCQLRGALASHLAHEEADVLPLVSRAMTAAGVAQTFRELGKLGGWKL